MLDRIRALADEEFPDNVCIRRALHQRPELRLEEHETAAFITSALRDIGLESIPSVGKTGVVAHNEGGELGPTLALRADIDALPIQAAASAPPRMGGTLEVTESQSRRVGE